MAHWDVWPELLNLRDRHRELSPIFARTGISPDLSAAANNVRGLLHRRLPTKPLATGDSDHDSKLMEGYHRHLKDQFEESFYKIGQLTRMNWPPEAEALAQRVHGEIQMLRAQRDADPDSIFDLTRLDKLLVLYSDLYQAGEVIDQEALAERKQLLIEVLGFPLLALRHQQYPDLELLPPLASPEYVEQLNKHLLGYAEQRWLHNSLSQNQYLRLTLDVAVLELSRRGHDRDWQLAQLPFTWPSLSRWLPRFEHADLVWYLLLSLLAIGSLLAEWWWLTLIVMIWLKLTIKKTREREAKLQEKQEALKQQLERMLKVREQVSQGRYDAKLLLKALRHPEFSPLLPHAGLLLLELLASD